jgi:hypothetical protein
MTKESLAALLNGREYPNEITRDEEKAAKQAGLIVLFGASDDLAEFRGVIHDEVGCFDGGIILVARDRIFEDNHECECEFCGFDQLRKQAHPIEAVWGEDDISWQYRTEIPHATFDVMEDGEVYCRGIVFEAKSTEKPRT